MQVIHSQCAGLDVHKKTVVVTSMLTQLDGTVQKRTRTFATMTADLLALDDWLKQQSIEVIALESTGVYWHPIYNILEDGRTVVLVNPQHMKAVPGRKTDIKDSEWLAEHLASWSAPTEFHSAQTNPRTARSHWLPQVLSC